MYVDINDPCIPESDNFKRKIIYRHIKGLQNAITYTGKDKTGIITTRVWANKEGIATDARII